MPTCSLRSGAARSQAVRRGDASHSEPHGPLAPSSRFRANTNSRVHYPMPTDSKSGTAEEVRIKCYARTRLTWANDSQHPSVHECIEIEDQQTLCLTKAPKLLEFDKVFDDQSSQGSVFDEVAEPLIENALAFMGHFSCTAKQELGKHRPLPVAMRVKKVSSHKQSTISARRLRILR